MIKDGYIHGFESYSLHFLCRAIEWGLVQHRAPNLQVRVCQGGLLTRGDIVERTLSLQNNDSVRMFFPVSCCASLFGGDAYFV